MCIGAVMHNSINMYPYAHNQNKRQDTELDLSDLDDNLKHVCT